MNGTSTSSPTAGAAGFATTHWTAIRVGAQSSWEANQARAELCRTYWHPVYFRLRRLGRAEHDAKDLTQDFFAYILGRAWLATADQNRGRFRSFLLTSLDHFLRDRLDRSNALKRGGNYQHIPLDLSKAETFYARSMAVGAGPEQAYEMEWANRVIDAAFRRLEAEFSTAGKKAHFDVLKTYLTVEGYEKPHESAAAVLGAGVEAVKSSIHRMRKRYGVLLREEVARTVASLDDVDEEMRHLRAIISSGVTLRP